MSTTNRRITDTSCWPRVVFVRDEYMYEILRPPLSAGPEFVLKEPESEDSEELLDPAKDTEEYAEFIQGFGG